MPRILTTEEDADRESEENYFLLLDAENNNDFVHKY